MGVPHRRNLIASRRRTDDDGEEEASQITGQEDELSSLGSAPSEADIDADADGEGSDGADATASQRSKGKKKNGYTPVVRSNGKTPEQTPTAKPTNFASSMVDTEAMMNGMQISDTVKDEEVVDFDQPVKAPSATDDGTVDAEEPTSAKVETLAERRKREHEEYKKKRDEDPAFVPNRGGFFMHDQRNAAGGQNGFRLAGRGRGRGRGGSGTAPVFK